jgi:malonyl-CoA O-methyltransferase
MLLFSTLGPATLRELREASARLADGRHIPEFPDLMEVGDGLVAGGFREPVMDMEIITVQYPSLAALMLELDSTGMSLLVPGWKFLLESAFSPGPPGGSCSVTYEIVYGTAYGPGEGQPVRTPDGDTATFSVESLLRSRRMR